MRKDVFRSTADAKREMVSIVQVEEQEEEDEDKEEQEDVTNRFFRTTPTKDLK